MNGDSGRWMCSASNRRRTKNCRRIETTVKIAVLNTVSRIDMRRDCFMVFLFHARGESALCSGAVSLGSSFLQKADAASFEQNGPNNFPAFAQNQPKCPA